MNTLSNAALSSLIALIMGCTVFVPKETLYLRSAQDRATQEEVRQRLGPPRSTVPTQGRETVWIYEVRELEPGSQNTWASIGSWCDEYRLTFDEHGVLRQWTHNSYVHPGEMMPVSCNSTIGIEKPAL
ncbi:MAG: hypothetical protein ACREIS_00540 [Nitrospiraceae bacterium]